nr:DUF11 domain-containing protein [Acidobacteriota bacterium]
TKASVVNTALINATTDNFNQPVSATTTLTTPVSPTSDLLVTKTHTVDDTTAGTNTAGNNLTYTITVKNNGQSTAAMITVVDTLPAGQTLAAPADVTQGAGLTCTPNTVGSGGVITCTGGTLLPNASAIVRLTVRIDPCLAPGIYNNVVTASSMSFDPVLANSTATDPVTVVARPDLAITKTVAAVGTSGNTLTYNIVATNNGPSCALDVMITDPLPPNTVLVSLTPSAGGVINTPPTPAIGQNGTVKVTFPGLTSPGTSRTLTIVISVGANVTCDTVLTNTATVSYTPRIPNPNPNPAIVFDVDPNPANNTSTATTTAQAQSDLSITKTGPAQAVYSTTNNQSNITYTLNFSNAGPSNSAGTMVVDTLPKGFTVVGTPTSTVPGTTFTITTAGGVTTVKANLGILGAAGQVGTNFPVGGTIVIVARIPIKHPTITVVNTATISTMNCLPDPNLANNTATASTFIVPPGTTPGQPYPALSEVSDQKEGSILFYPIYTSDAVNGTTQNTRVSITNTSNTERVTVHLFAVDGASCAVLDAFICLTPNQTTVFLASDFDPGNTGYLMVVAVEDATGMPRAFNELIGDEYVKFSTGHAANLGAEAIAAVMMFPGGADPNVTTTTLRFDGMNYNRLPYIVAADNIPSPNDGNSTMLILDRIGGNMLSTGASVGSFFGNLYNDSESAFSFTATGGCQFRSLLTNNFPRTFTRFTTILPAGRSGWIKLFTVDEKALLGSVINFNPNAMTNAGAFNQGHNLHKLTLTDTATIVVPVLIPACQ